MNTAHSQPTCPITPDEPVENNNIQYIYMKDECSGSGGREKEVACQGLQVTMTEMDCHVPSIVLHMRRAPFLLIFY